MDNRPLGFFDSGVGGISVLGELQRQLPHEDVIYFGDTAHVPYGDKSAQALLGYSRDIMDFLLAQGAKAVVVACNTVSATILGELKALYPALPLVGMIKAGARAAVRTTRNHKIGVIATQNVVRAAAYTSLIQNEDCRYQVVEQACPALVPLIEAGVVSGSQVRQEVRGYMRPLLERQIDTLVLGCTHYPFLQPLIEEVAGEGVRLVDPAAGTIQEMGDRLRAQGALHTGAGGGDYLFHVSGDPEVFRRTARLLFPGLAEGVQHTALDTLIRK
jgi:glutamate racemase